MRSWQEDLLAASEAAATEQELFERIVAGAHTLGFEHCAYGLRMPLPVTSPKTVMLNNYPEAWRRRYAEAGYLAVDPTVQHGRRSTRPLLWSEAVFADAPTLWSEARDAGLRHGWAQSSLDARGVGGMLTLSRSTGPLGAAELAAQEIKMRWLVNVAHLSLARLLTARERMLAPPELTSRETEVLKWTADGKTAGEISILLAVSENTVNFHIKNAVAKLQTANKTAAVVRAAMLGLLN